ncbi:MAG: aspartate aminotransferase family protein [Rhodospirillales bacterium]|nr:aspartate aminotransferase family protein [Rhodospirillales bacterium]
MATSVRSTNAMDSFWMPFTANRRFMEDPRIVKSAADMHYVTADGRKLLDGTAGLWCVNAGHARPKIVEAVSAAIAELDYAPSYQFGHPGAFELAGRIASVFPGDLNHVFFTNSGSESVDTALKIALAYHQSRGEGTRTRLIGRERAYHGVGFGGISVGGIATNRRHFGSLLAGVDHLPHTHAPEHNAYSRGMPEWGAHLADDLERMVALHDPSTIAAVIVEPMAGSAGVLPPPKGYLERLRAICDKYGILLIFDEVITAFGRVGAGSAAELLGVQPDLMATAKGLTSGTIPMGAVIADAKIYKSVTENSATPIEFFHGYTYSGHPVAVAAAMATLDIYAEEGLFQRAAELTPYFEDVAHNLRDLPNVIDIRNMGMVAGIELAPRPGAVGERGFEAMQMAFERGAMIRITADTIALSPPLIISKEQIDELFDLVAGVIRDLK